MSNRKETCSINGTTYGYKRRGNGETVVLLHGFTGTSRTWKATMEKMSKNYDVLAIDLPGHGQTEAFDRTMETCSRDIKELLRQLGINRAHFIGYSFGGRVALYYTIHHPETVLSLTLESASPGLNTEAEREKRRRHDDELARRIETEGLESFVNFWENIPLFHTQKKLPKERQQAIREERLTQKEEGLACALRNLGTGSQPSLWQKLSSIQIPVCLIVGEKDRKFVELNEKMAKHIQNISIYIVQHAGHNVHVEQQEKFVKIVMTFLSKNT